MDSPNKVTYQWYRHWTEEGPEELQVVWVNKKDPSLFLTDYVYSYYLDFWSRRDISQYRKEWRMLPTLIEHSEPIEGATSASIAPTYDFNERLSCKVTYTNKE